MNESPKNEYFAIFGGGGIRGISYCGAYKALIENNIGLTGYAGSSIGAVFATLIAVGYSWQESYEILCEAGFDVFKDININFANKISFSKGNILLEWIREKIEKKFYGKNYEKGSVAPVAFKDIDKQLVIFSVDLTNMKFKEFSTVKTPDFEIATAVRASVSMPGLFTPLELDDCLIVDGDLLKSSPLWRLSDTIKDVEARILEFRLEDNETSGKTDNSIEYINRVYNAFCGFATDYVIDVYKNKDKFDYIKIDTPNVSVVDFLIPKEKKQELFDIGYNTVNKYFKEFYPIKKKLLKEKYENLLKHLNKLSREFGRFNIINSYLSLCEIFVYLCEEKKYIDSRIYDEICNFKNNFTKEFSTYNFLGFKGAKIKNKDEFSRQLIKITNDIVLKIESLNP